MEQSQTKANPIDLERLESCINLVLAEAEQVDRMLDTGRPIPIARAKLQRAIDTLKLANQDLATLIDDCANSDGEAKPFAWDT